MLIFAERATVRPNTVTEEKIRQCNLEATQCINAKNYAKAIELLRTSRELMPKTNTNYSLASYLRLPLVLQKAGFFDESVHDLKHFLNKRNNPFDLAIVHDKLRLVYQREKVNYETAVVHAVASLAWESLGRFGNRVDIAAFQEPAIWQKKIKPLLKKLKMEECLEPIVSRCVFCSEVPNKDDIESLVRFTRELLSHSDVALA